MDKKKSLGGSYVFFKHLMGPIKWNVGCPHLHLFMEEKNPTISNTGKRRLVKNKKNLTNQKSNKRWKKQMRLGEK